MLTDLTNLHPYRRSSLHCFIKSKIGSNRELPDAVESVALLVDDCCRALYTCHRLRGSSLALLASVPPPISLCTSDTTIFFAFDSFIILRVLD